MQFAYKGITGYQPDGAAGGSTVPKNDYTMPQEGANNIGTAGGDVDAPGLWDEGGPVSKLANEIPGVNSAAGVHDVFQVKINQYFDSFKTMFNQQPLAINTGALMRNVLNIAGMPIAAAVSYPALMVGPQLQAVQTSRAVNEYE
jgi:hypothetical protein